MNSIKTVWNRGPWIRNLWFRLGFPLHETVRFNSHRIEILRPRVYETRSNHSHWIEIQRTTPFLPPRLAVRTPEPATADPRRTTEEATYPGFGADDARRRCMAVLKRRSTTDVQILTRPAPILVGTDPTISPRLREHPRLVTRDRRGRTAFAAPRTPVVASPSAQSSCPGFLCIIVEFAAALASKRPGALSEPHAEVHEVANRALDGGGRPLSPTHPVQTLDSPMVVGSAMAWVPGRGSGFIGTVSRSGRRIWRNGPRWLAMRVSREGKQATGEAEDPNNRSRRSYCHLGPTRKCNTWCTQSWARRVTHWADAQGFGWAESQGKGPNINSRTLFFPFIV
jgi:hypothetical protein